MCLSAERLGTVSCSFHKHALGSGVDRSRVLHKDYARSKAPHESQGMYLAIIRLSPTWRLLRHSVKNHKKRAVETAQRSLLGVEQCNERFNDPVVG